jgi:hypothetical protein
MTAYSTAVGPSSDARNRLTLFVNVFIAGPYLDSCNSVPTPH